MSKEQTASVLKKYERMIRYAHITTFLTAVIVLIGLERELLGWILLIAATIVLLFCSPNYRKHLLVIHVSAAALGLFPIGTDTSPPFSLLMGCGLLIAVLLPFIVTRFAYKNDAIRFPVRGEKAWTKKRYLYLLLTVFLSWILLPIILRSGNSYMNWELDPGFWKLTEAYLGLNAIGIWDELFFILTLLAILKRFFPFIVANLFQAVFFTSFLYAVGFQGWGFLAVYAFALSQGYIYRHTKSLYFILAIHLTVDLMLHLALLHLHYPEIFPYFIT